MKSSLKKRKGFIGPIGDDLPSLISIMLALTIFFTGVVFAINAYKDKEMNLDILKGTLEISRAYLEQGILPNNLNTLPTETKDKINNIKTSYGLTSTAGFKKDAFSCSNNEYSVSFLVIKWDAAVSQQTYLDSLIICVKKV